jgi:hypothetical protein
MVVERLTGIVESLTRRCPIPISEFHQHNLPQPLLKATDKPSGVTHPYDSSLVTGDLEKGSRVPSPIYGSASTGE